MIFMFYIINNKAKKFNHRFQNKKKYETTFCPKSF